MRGLYVARRIAPHRFLAYYAGMETGDGGVYVERRSLKATQPFKIKLPRVKELMPRVAVHARPALEGPGDAIPGSEDYLELETGETYPLGEELIIGRSPECGIQIPEYAVSRIHLVIRREGGSYLLYDKNSTNGTYVSGTRVTDRPIVLRDGDAIRIGDCRLTFREANKSVEEGLVPPPDGETTPGPRCTTLLNLPMRPKFEAIPLVLLVGDIKNSCHYAEALGEKTYSTVVSQWIGRCQTVIERRGGIMNKFTGDGFLAYWKWQKEVTLEPALFDLIGVGVFAEEHRNGFSGLDFRLCLHHGFVAVGDMPQLGETPISGSIVNYTFRMDKLAKSLARDVLLSDAALKNLRWEESLADLGCHKLDSFEGEHRFYGWKNL